MKSLKQILSVCSILCFVSSGAVARSGKKTHASTDETTEFNRLSSQAWDVERREREADEEAKAMGKAQEFLGLFLAENPVRLTAALHRGVYSDGSPDGYFFRIDGGALCRMHFTLGAYYQQWNYEPHPGQCFYGDTIRVSCVTKTHSSEWTKELTQEAVDYGRCAHSGYGKDY